MKYFVTGGAGFIGSNIVDYLISKGNKVIVYDNLSTGRREFIAHHLKNPDFKFVQGDLNNTTLLANSLKNCDFVFHLAAHADVRSGVTDHFIDHNQNLEMTHNVLEAVSTTGIKKLAFISTSSVYGDAKIHPTPEDYPFQPTSLYGATKAACESYIQAYSSYFGFQSYIFRLVSFTGERYTHGIAVDILKKLKDSPKLLTLLSDGTPKKSSLYVGDGIEAFFTVIKKANEKVNIYNIGHDQVLSVKQIAQTVLQASSNSGVKIKWLGKQSNWKGDNTFVLLDNSKLKRLGWEPKHSVKDGITKTVQYLLKSNLI